MAARTFEDLEAWRRAHQWVLHVYERTACFPRTELFGLTGQLRRAAVSVPSNIAEGFARRSKHDKARLYNIAQGSLEDARYQLILARDLRYADTSDLLAEAREVGALLGGYTETVLASARPTLSPLLASVFLLLASLLRGRP